MLVLRIWSCICRIIRYDFRERSS